MCEVRVKVVALSFLFLTIIAICIIVYKLSIESQSSARHLNTNSADRILTKDELRQYTGKDGGSIYIAIIGQVFDVTKGRKHYSQDGGYHGFAGRDGSRAFVTGKFDDEGLVDDITDLKVAEVAAIDEWRQFYQNDYTYVGKLCGTFYDCETGESTPALHSFQRNLEQARDVEAGERQEALRFPPCNTQWRQNEGGRVWCSDNSGGIKREWVGLPRQLHVKSSGQTRCACILNYGPPSDDPSAVNHDNVGDLNNPRLRLFDNCRSDSVSCSIPES